MVRQLTHSYAVDSTYIRLRLKSSLEIKAIVNDVVPSPRYFNPFSKGDDNHFASHAFCISLKMKMIFLFAD